MIPMDKYTRLEIGIPKQDVRPWKIKPLDEWSIVGMNHYRQDGQQRLFVAMTKDGKAIVEEGVDDEYLWNRLWHKAFNAGKED